MVNILILTFLLQTNRILPERCTTYVSCLSRNLVFPFLAGSAMGKMGISKNMEAEEPCKIFATRAKSIENTIPNYFFVN
jgi:hypothetical protein